MRKCRTLFLCSICRIYCNRTTRFTVGPLSSGHSFIRPLLYPATLVSGHSCLRPLLYPATLVSGHSCLRPLLYPAIPVSGHSCIRPLLYPTTFQCGHSIVRLLWFTVQENGLELWSTSIFFSWKFHLIFKEEMGGGEG